MIKRFLLYIILVIAISVWTILYESYELALLWIFLVILPLILFVMLYISNKKLEVQHMIPKDKVCKGEYIPIVFNVNNGGLFPIVLMSIQIECVNELYNVSTKEVFEIPTLKRGKQSFSFSMKSLFCGNVKIILKEMRVSDYLHLFSLKKSFDLEKVIPVIPEVKIIECDNIPNNMFATIDSDIFSKNKKGDDPSEVFDIRDYHEGDELHSVHWKLSAKKDSLVVKELSYPLSSGIVIMMEMFSKLDDKNRHRYIDATIDVVIAMSLKLQECGYPHYIAWYDEKSNQCKRIRIEENTQITEAIVEIYKSKVYSDGLKLLEVYNAQFFQEQCTHVYYLVTSFDTKNIESLKYNRENAFINYMYITYQEEDISEEARTVIEANDIILQTIECKNINNTIEAITF